MTLENVDVECTHCRKHMTAHHTEGSPVKYFHCANCHRWVSSSYTEVFRADAKVRTRAQGQASSVVDQVKGRLERWLAALDDQDPYRTLGVSPMDSEATVRERYLELARTHHPDRGGSPEQMRQINDAYERVLTHRERKAKAQQLGSGPSSPGLPSSA